MDHVAAQENEPATRARPAVPKRSGEGFRRVQVELHKILSHKGRCRDLGKPSDAEVARIVAEFLARGGQVKRLDTGHAAPIQNGAGRDADRWTL